MNEFIWPVRVYYEDTDSGGVIYYANYLKFMERARTEWLRSIGFEQDKLLSGENIVFVVRSVTLDFHKPGRFNQLLNVISRIIERGKASLTFEQKVVSHPENSILCAGQVKLACVDAIGWRPCPIPATIAAQIPAEI